MDSLERSGSSKLQNLKNDMLAISKLALPIIGAQVAWMLMAIVDSVFVGHLGKDYLAASVLGNTYSFAILMMGQGIVAAIETLCSQAFGAGNYRLVALWCQRGIITCSFACIPISVLWWFTEDILILGKESPSIASLAGLYSRLLLIGLWPFYAMGVYSKYLQAQGIVSITMIVMWFGVLLNIVFNQIFVFGFGPFKGWGFVGSPLATSVTRWTTLGLLWLYVRLRKLDSITFTRWSWKEAFSHQRQVIAMSLPASVMITFEVLVFQLCTFLAGWISETALDAHSIVMQMTALAYMVPLGISMAATTIVGNQLGAGHPSAAKRAAYVSIVGAAVISLLSITILFCSRNVVGRAYTNEADVVALVSVIIPICNLTQLFDTIQGVCGGVLRGMGRPTVGAFANLAGLLLIGVPTAYVLAFVVGKKNVLGLWWGLVLGLVITASVELVAIIFFVNWRKESERAQAISKSQATSHPTDTVPLFSIETHDDEDNKEELRNGTTADGFKALSQKEIQEQDRSILKGLHEHIPIHIQAEEHGASPRVGTPNSKAGGNRTPLPPRAISVNRDDVTAVSEANDVELTESGALLSRHRTKS
mmetsp:Transcript_37756/g.61176  ORF Transcript_37756/g.61176 Transcript_37756/m.61176 type:complete len:591 (-) Transcript_37756:182-1954(-)